MTGDVAGPEAGLTTDSVGGLVAGPMRGGGAADPEAALMIGVTENLRAGRMRGETATDPGARRMIDGVADLGADHTVGGVTVSQETERDSREACPETGRRSRVKGHILVACQAIPAETRSTGMIT